MMSCHTPEVNKHLTGSNTPEVHKQTTSSNIANKLEEKLIVNKRLLETRGRVCYTPPSIPPKLSKKLLMETREQVSLPNSTIKINCPTPTEVNKQLTRGNITKLEDKLIVNKKLLETRGERVCYTPPTLSAKYPCHTPEVNKQLTGSNFMVETREQVSLPNSTLKVKGLLDEVNDTNKRLETLQQNVQERLDVLKKKNSAGSGSGNTHSKQTVVGNGSGNFGCRQKAERQYKSQQLYPQQNDQQNSIAVTSWNGSGNTGSKQTSAVNGSGNIERKQSAERYPSQQQNKEVLNKIEANYQEMLAKINALSLDTKNAMKKF